MRKVLLVLGSLALFLVASLAAIPGAAPATTTLAYPHEALPLAGAPAGAPSTAVLTPGGHDALASPTASTPLTPGTRYSVTFGLTPVGAGTIYFNALAEYQGSTASVNGGAFSLNQTANAGWHFASWTATAGITVGWNQVWVNATGTLTATYVAYPVVNFQINPGGCGPVTFNLTNFASGGSGSFYAQALPYGFAVPLCASLSFQGWAAAPSSALTIASPTALTTTGVLSSNATLYANFTGSLTVHFGVLGPAGSGVILLDLVPYFNGSSNGVSPGLHTLGVLTNPWAHFASWSTSTPQIKVGFASVEVNASGWINATFVSYPAVAFKVLPALSPCLTLSFNGTTYTTGTSGNFYLASPTYAIVDPACVGYTFINWSASGNLSVASPLSGTTTATLSGNATLTENYSLSTSTFTLSFAVSPAGAGGILFGGSAFFNGQTTKKTSGTYSLGEITVPGYRFTGWSTTGNVAVGAGTVTISPPSSPAGDALTADFATYPTVSFSWSPVSCGPVTFNGTAQANGSSGSFFAAPPAAAYVASVPACAGSTFAGWSTSGGVTVVSVLALTTNVNVTANGTLVATFMPNPTYSVDFSIAPSWGGWFSLNGNLYYNGQIAFLPAGSYPFALQTNPFAKLAYLNATGGLTLGSGVLNVTGSGTVAATFTPLVSISVSVAPSTCAPQVNGASAPNGTTLWVAPGTYAFAPANCTSTGWYYPPVVATSAGVSQASSTSLTVASNGTLNLWYYPLLGLTLHAPSTAVQGQSATFTTSVAGGSNGPYELLWQWGDGSPLSATTGTDRSPSGSHTYANAGTFTVTLEIVDNASGQHAWTSASLTVSACSGCSTSKGVLGSTTTDAVVAIVVLIAIALLLLLYMRRRRHGSEGSKEAPAAAAAGEEGSKSSEASRESEGKDEPPEDGEKGATTGSGEKPSSEEKPAGAEGEAETGSTPSDAGEAPASESSGSSPDASTGGEAPASGTGGESASNPPAGESPTDDQVTVEDHEGEASSHDAPDD